MGHTLCKELQREAQSTSETSWDAWEHWQGHLWSSEAGRRRWGRGSWQCGAGGCAGNGGAVMGTMHRKLERAAARHAAGGREMLRSTEGCMKAGGGSSAQLGPAGAPATSLHIWHLPFPSPGLVCPSFPWPLLLGPHPRRPNSQGMGTLLKLAALTLGHPLPGGSSATPGSPWGEGSRRVGSSLPLACIAVGRGVALGC